MSEIIRILRKVISSFFQTNLEVWDFFKKTYPYIDKIMQSKLGEESIENQSQITTFPHKETFPAEFVNEYNSYFKKFTKKLLEKEEIITLSLNQKSILFFALRLSLCVLAYQGHCWSVILISLLQFIFLPYSLISCLLTGWEIIYYFSSGYYIYLLIAYSFKYLLENFFNLQPLNYILSFNFEITNKFILFTFIADYGICFVSLFLTRYGKSLESDFKNHIKSFIYGSLNGKTYNFTLLCMLRGAKLPMLFWLLDFLFSLGERIKHFYEKNPMRAYSIHFYHAHRIGHLPKIYNDAHKFHHFYSQTSPFDSHLFGVGGPEDWLFFMFDLLFCLSLNTLPSTFCAHLMIINYDFKLSHTKIDNESDYFLYHLDHHTYATKNFTWSASVDMLFSTSSKKEKYDDGYFIISKESDEKEISISYQLVDKAKTE